MPDKSRHNKIQGQSLVEALVAMGVILIGVLGVFTLLTKSIGINRIVIDRYVATYIAAEGIEVVKNIIDTNIVKVPASPFNNGVTTGTYEVQYNDTSLQGASGRTLLFDPNTKLFQYNFGNPTSFMRTIEITTLSGGEEIQVNSRVDYTTHGATFSINLEDHFYNWR